MIQTGFLVSRPTQVALTASSRLPVRVFHPLRSDFPDTSGSLKCVYLALLQPPHGRDRSGLGSVPFARHYSGYRYFLPLPAGTKMFQFPTFAPDYNAGCAGFTCTGCPIRTPADHFMLADPRRFSQLAASFLASGSLGILRSLFSPFSRESDTPSIRLLSVTYIERASFVSIS